jgi:hypothetical protein
MRTVRGIDAPFVQNIFLFLNFDHSPTDVFETNLVTIVLEKKQEFTRRKISDYHG